MASTFFLKNVSGASMAGQRIIRSRHRILHPRRGGKFHTVSHTHERVPVCPGMTPSSSTSFTKQNNPELGIVAVAVRGIQRVESRRRCSTRSRQAVALPGACLHRTAVPHHSYTGTADLALPRKKYMQKVPREKKSLCLVHFTFTCIHTQVQSNSS
jgi:hypothetical protein